MTVAAWFLLLNDCPKPPLLEFSRCCFVISICLFFFFFFLHFLLVHLNFTPVPTRVLTELELYSKLVGSRFPQKLDQCSLAQSRKIIATARMLGFSSNCARLLEISCILKVRVRISLVLSFQILLVLRSQRWVRNLLFRSP